MEILEIQTTVTKIKSGFDRPVNLIQVITNLKIGQQNLFKSKHKQVKSFLKRKQTSKSYETIYKLSNRNVVESQKKKGEGSRKKKLKK